MIAHSPLHRSRRAALPHRAPALGDDAKPLRWRMAIATSPEGSSPMPPELVTEALQCCPVAGHAVVADVTGQGGAQVLPLLGDGLRHTTPQLGLDLAELRTKPLRHRCRRTVKRPFLVLPQMCVKPRKSNVPGFPSPRRALLLAA